MHHAVVLGIRFGGYGIVRALNGYGIPVVGFERDLACPEARTGLCEVRPIRDEDDLIRQLLALSQAQAMKPVLYLSSDEFVEFCSRHLALLQRHFLIDFPAAETVSMLLHKDQFAPFAERHGFTIPQTLITKQRGDLERVLNQVRLPCIVKPYKHTENWRNSGYPKAVRFTRRRELARVLEAIMAVEEHLVIQEWIPGGDDAVYFCLAYYDRDSRCLGSFVGRKLRQWLPGTGSTSAAEPIDAPVVRSETARLFDLVSYTGFGSVEFKRHAYDGAFYIMEPTVGRVNQQSLIAPANGMNLPALAYTSLTGIPLPGFISERPPTLYCDEEAELYNLIRHAFRGGLDIRSVLRSYKKRKAFRYYTREDPRPFLHFLKRMTRKIPARIVEEYRLRSEKLVPQLAHESA